MVQNQYLEVSWSKREYELWCSEKCAKAKGVPAKSGPKAKAPAQEGSAGTLPSRVRIRDEIRISPRGERKFGLEEKV